MSEKQPSKTAKMLGTILGVALVVGGVAAIAAGVYALWQVVL